MSAKPKRIRNSKPPSVEEQLAAILPAGIVATLGSTGPAFNVDPTRAPDGFRSIGGSPEVAANVAMLSEVLSMVPLSPDPRIAAARIAGAVAMVEAFAPKDPVEAMLAVQAVACHLMGMEAGRRTLLPQQQPEVAAKLRKDAANLMRGAADMVDALARHRGKGPQVVRVERVIVQEGGQAVVGHVQAGNQPALGSAATPLALLAEPVMNSAGSRG